jgi:glycosyltransferase involved in cell wall biosynthesis
VLTPSRPAVSVILPTYHRPDLLRRAVASILSQELDDGDLELVVAVSDALSAEDLATARSLAAADARVVVAVARRLGPAAARNAAMEVARGEVLAFIDDDCEARPGWLRSGLARARDCDVVQGTTIPAGPAPTFFNYTINIAQLSWRWETCNLFVRRSAADRTEGFDEEWNPRKRHGLHWGEDTEWGWRVVRAGATHAFEPDAVVAHAVFPRTFAQQMEYLRRARFMPLFVQRMPEVRRSLYRGYFMNRGQVRMAAAAGFAGAAVVAYAAGQRRAARALAVLGVAPVVAPSRDELYRMTEDVVTFGAALYGSVRYRRLVL